MEAEWLRPQLNMAAKVTGPLCGSVGDLPSNLVENTKELKVSHCLIKPLKPALRRLPTKLQMLRLGTYSHRQ